MIGVNRLKTDAEVNRLDLIDLLSDRHNMVRRISGNAWNEANEIKISSSEWYILARIYRKQPTISSVTKSVDISRQAIHKFIKNLAAKGLVEIHNVENNKKEKWIQLTDLGEECYEKNEVLKDELEKRIAETIGQDKIDTLKVILKSDWGI
ncbi:MarR family winged helix-turn-helix transcriptional regulator [Planomicrobium sp. YIM 101495]|uniref:MarR family winged helix-turn-helix transcriptional regulator n=1 Tax=Planomicrobium sp. YIM 101495 TaxID=2665160 RepID=UPI0012B87706|nr:MarR family transcriptional regulator [Planomicrobium sp. YIM 101495]MTD31570.1 winged helix DNA-binding protein [Planomicrobium sp. YIM 101495]